MAGISGPKSSGHSIFAQLNQCEIARNNAITEYSKVHAQVTNEIDALERKVHHLKNEEEILGYNTQIQNLHRKLEQARREGDETLNKISFARRAIIMNFPPYQEDEVDSKDAPKATVERKNNVSDPEEAIPLAPRDLMELMTRWAISSFAHSVARKD